MTDEEKKELIAERDALMAEGRELGYLPPEESAVSKTIKGGLKAYDYQRGAVQRGLLELMGQSELLTPEEKAGALDPTTLQTAPGYQDIIERKFPGVSKWISAPAGFVGDVALDPTTYESGGLTALAKLGKLGGKVGKLLEKATPGSILSKIGEKLYRIPFSKADQAIREAVGPESKVLSDLVIEKGIWGRRATMHKKLNDVYDDLVQAQQDLLKGADESGALINLEKVTARAKSIAEDFRKHGAPDAANFIENKIKNIKAPYTPKPKPAKVTTIETPPDPFNLGAPAKPPMAVVEPGKVFPPRPVLPSEAAKIKTFTSKDISPSARGGVGVSDLENQGLKALEGDLIEAVEKVPGYGEEIARVNKEMIPIYGGAKAEKLALRREATMPPVRGVDRYALPAMLAGSDDVVQSAGRGGTYMLYRKIMDLLFDNPALMTGLGKVGMKAGQSGLVTPAILQGTRQATAPKSPWSLLEEDENGR